MIQIFGPNNVEEKKVSTLFCLSQRKQVLLVCLFVCWLGSGDDLSGEQDSQVLRFMWNPLVWARICRVLVGDWDTRRRLLVAGAFEEERAVKSGSEGNEVVSFAFSSRRMVNQRCRKIKSFVDRRRRGVRGELRRRGRRERSRRSWRRGFWSRRTHFELNLTNTELWKI